MTKIMIQKVITAILAIMTTIKVLTMIIVIAIMVEIMFYLCSTPFDHMKLPLKHNNFSTLAAGKAKACLLYLIFSPNIP